jgi:hypothetical protein
MIFLDVPLSALQFKQFHWQEPVVINLASSVRRKLLLEICLPVPILFIPKELQHREQTSTSIYATILFMELFPHVDFHD